MRLVYGVWLYTRGVALAQTGRVEEAAKDLAALRELLKTTGGRCTGWRRRSTRAFRLPSAGLEGLALRPAPRGGFRNTGLSVPSERIPFVD